MLCDIVMVIVAGSIIFWVWHDFNKNNKDGDL